MFDHLLESSHRDDSNKWSNIRFGEEITLVESVEVNFTHLIWSSVFQNDADNFFKETILYPSVQWAKELLYTACP